MNDSAICINNATVFIGQKKVLDDISFKIDAGEKYFIIGANGAGKTTLVKLLLGYVWPLFGASVKVLGQKYGETNLNLLRKSIAWVSPFIQQYLDPTLTGLDMILSGQEGFLGFYRKATQDELSKATDLLANLGALHLANKSIMGMSSGEQIKILIARALFIKPSLMILDEPNVFLDIAEKEFLLNTLTQIANKNPELTMIFISQRIEDILPIFDNGMILNSGKIVQVGKRDEILNEVNLEKAFGVKVKCVKNSSGRIWALVD